MIKKILLVSLFVSESIVLISEDLRLADDGKSLRAVSMVTNTVSREDLVKLETQWSEEIRQAYSIIQANNQKLNDVRRYLATLDALRSLKDTNALPSITNAIQPILSTNSAESKPIVSTNAPSVAKAIR